MDNAIPLKFELYSNPNYNHIRRCKIMLISHILNTYYDKFKAFDYDTKHTLICELERSCFHAAIDKDVPKYWTNPQFEGVYSHICYNLICNLDPNSTINSRYLGDLILNKGVDLAKVGYMTSREMCPEKYIEYDENMNKRSSLTQLKTTELYKCYKCKKNQCTLETIVNRSIDEGSSLIVRCTFCGASWGG